MLKGVYTVLWINGYTGLQVYSYYKLWLFKKRFFARMCLQTQALVIYWGTRKSYETTLNHAVSLYMSFLYRHPSLLYIYSF